MHASAASACSRARLIRRPLQGAIKHLHFTVVLVIFEELASLLVHNIGTITFLKQHIFSSDTVSIVLALVYV